MPFVLRLVVAAVQIVLGAVHRGGGSVNKCDTSRGRVLPFVSVGYPRLGLGLAWQLTRHCWDLVQMAGRPTGKHKAAGKKVPHCQR